MAYFLTNLRMVWGLNYILCVQCLAQGTPIGERMPFLYHVVTMEIYSCSSYCYLFKSDTLKLGFKIWDPGTLPDSLFSY